MVHDLEMVALAYGPDEGFTLLINDNDGNPDDLTAYTSVKLVISDMRYSIIKTHITPDPEIQIDANGIFKYKPTSSNPVPLAGKYYVQIFRKLTPTQNFPTRKQSLLTTNALEIL